MTIDDARVRIGRIVKYLPGTDRAEVGEITAVSSDWVFVMYAGDTTSKATRPEDLEFLT